MKTNIASLGIILLNLFVSNFHVYAQDTIDAHTDNTAPCATIMGNNPSPYFYIHGKVNNYTQHFEYLKCEITNNALLPDGDIQDMSMFSMYQQIEQHYKKEYIKEQMERQPMFSKTLNNTMLESFDHFMLEHDTARVVIINDDHARVETRAFFLSILPKLKTLGYNCLAMEAFQDVLQTKPSFYLGYYFQEPVMAEIYRTAKRLNMKLIQYEYTGNGTNETRDSTQAINLYDQLKSLKKDDKVVVFSGQSHLVEDCSVCPALFGSVFKNISHVDALTIDQTRGLEWVYYPDIHFDISGISKGGIIKSSATGLKDQLGFSFVDAFYIHPKYTYINGRPSWLSCGNIRKPYKIKKKYGQQASLIQVYYKDEVPNKKSYDYVTPADMVSSEYMPDDSITFYLVPDHKYVLVYRDSKNAILNTKDFAF